MAQTDISIIVKAKDEATKELAKVTGSLGTLNESAVKASKAIAVGFAAAGAAAIAFATSSVKDFADVGSAVYDMSKRTGLGAEAISALKLAAEASGASLESVETAIKKMQMGMDDMNITSQDFNEYLEAVGITMDDIKKMAPEEQFARIGNGIANIIDPAERTRVAIEAFGKAGTEIIPMFEDGSFSIEEMSDKAKELGVSFDDLSAAKADALGDAMGELDTAFQGFKLQLGEKLAPILIDFINNYLPKIIEGVGQFIEKTKAIVGWLKEHESVMIIVAGAITGVLVPAIFAALIPALIAGATAFIGMAIAAAPFLLAGAVIGGIVAGIWWLSKNWDTVTELMQSAWQALADAFAGIANGIKNTIGSAFDWVVSKANKVIEVVNQAIALANKLPGVNIGSVGSIPGRAVGGPVTAGSPYIVGERGPELFMPNASGTIIPNGSLGGGGSSLGGVTINIGTFVGGNPDAAARELGDLIIKRLQLNARIG